MANVMDMGDRGTKLIRRIARIWGALIIAIALFIIVGYLASLLNLGTADPYAVEDYPPIENLPPLSILLSSLGLGIAWRWERLGGALAVFFQLAALPLLLIIRPISPDTLQYLIAPYGVSLMVTIPGILFLVSWWRSRGTPVVSDGV